ncbi:hypothetical protein FIV37_14490 [Pseudomonas gessardii]|nr:hypothetical protein [Pseudomonas gessardii]
MPAMASTSVYQEHRGVCIAGKPAPTLIFGRQKKPRTWRGIFMGEDYRPSSMALLRTAPLSALVASRA